MKVTILDIIETWWLSVERLLASFGVVGKFERSPIDRPNPSCSLNLRRGNVEADLLVWESGESELATAASNGAVQQEHFDDIRNCVALGEVLSRVLKLVHPA